MDTQLKIEFNLFQAELELIESKLLDKEELLLHEKERLEEEMRQKEQQIQEWEHEFHQKEMEFLSKEEFIKEQYNKNLLETRSDLENQYSTSMQQLRTDLDEDYQQQLRRLEASLNDHYGAEISQLNSRHQEQVLWWSVFLVVVCVNVNGATSRTCMAHFFGNLSQSSPSVAILVFVWSIATCVVFFYLSRVLFFGFRLVKKAFVTFLLCIKLLWNPEDWIIDKLQKNQAKFCKMCYAPFDIHVAMVILYITLKIMSKCIVM